MTKRVFVGMASIAWLLGACSTTASLFPIDGPLSKQVPLPVLVARVDGILGNTGGIKLTMPDGEVCSGKWSSIAPTSSSISTGFGSASFSNGMQTAWATAFGTSITSAIVPGVNRGEAMLVGASGTVMQVLFFTGSGTANGTGVATDNKGNSYKVLF